MFNYTGLEKNVHGASGPLTPHPLLTKTVGIHLYYLGAFGENVGSIIIVLHCINFSLAAILLEVPPKL